MSSVPPEWFTRALAQVHGAGLLFAGKSLDEYRVLDAWDMWKERGSGRTSPAPPHERVVARLLALDPRVLLARSLLTPSAAEDLLHELSRLRAGGEPAFRLASTKWEGQTLRVKIADRRWRVGWPTPGGQVGLGQLIALCTHLLGRSLFQWVPAPGAFDGRTGLDALVVLMPDEERGRLEALGLVPAAAEPLALPVEAEAPPPP